MAGVGFKLYHIRGHYYTTSYKSDSDPLHLGREILAEVPADPAEYELWKKERTVFCSAEEERIQKIAKNVERVNAAREAQEIFNQVEVAAWGRNYDSKPSRTIDYNKSFIWQYIIDIDTDKFTITGPGDVQDDQYYALREFRLNNIPRWLFDLPFTKLDEAEYQKPPLRLGFFQTPAVRVRTGTHPVITTRVPGEYIFLKSGRLPALDQESLEAYRSSWVEQIFPQYARDYSSVWKSFRFLLLKQFLHRYDKVFQGYFWDSIKSPFTFRQMVYAVVSLAHEQHTVLFREKTYWYENRIGCRKKATPWWEPPDSDAYWIGRTLILIVPDLDHPENLHAAIGKAVVLTKALENATIIIFSISSIAVAHINHAPHGTSITHTPTMKLFSSLEHTCCSGGGPPKALLALLDTLSHRVSNAPQRLCLPHLPTEVCENIFDHATPETRNALKASCKQFKMIAGQYPLLGGWRLFQSRRCPSKYAAVSKVGASLRNMEVKAEYMQHEKGYEIGVSTGNGVLELDMPLFHVSTGMRRGCSDNYPEHVSSDVEDHGWDDEDDVGLGEDDGSADEAM